MRKALILTLFLFLCGPVFGAEVVRYVDTGSAGGDGTTTALTGANAAYASLATWNTGEATNLVTAEDTHVVNCAASTGVNDTPLTESGWTSSATYFPRIQGTDFTGVWADSAYIIEGTNEAVVTISETYFEISNIQVLVNETGAGQAYGIRMVSGVLLIDGVLVKGVCSGTGQAYGIHTSVGTANVVNSAVFGFRSGADTQFYGFRSESGTMNVYNSVVYDCYQGYFRWTGAMGITNSVAATCTDDFGGLSQPSPISYCVSDDGDGTNSLGPVSGNWANEFTNAAAGDFTPVSGGNILVAGANDPGSGLFSTDIIGASYVTDSWARGVYAEATGITTGFMMISKDFWKNFFQDGIKGKWRIAA